MKYFRIYISYDKKIIGKSPQVSGGLFPTKFDSPNSLGMLLFEKAMINVEVPKAILEKKAKLIDIISANFLLSGQFFISSKLKSIISKYAIEGLEFFNTSVIFEDKEIKDFWIINPYKSNFSFLDFENTEFVFTNSMGSVVMENIRFKELKEYLQALEQNKLDAIKIGYPNFKPLAIKKIVLKENSKIDIFSLKGIFGGIGIFVSERLKNEIEKAGCTGIVFTEPNEKYP